MSGVMQHAALVLAGALAFDMLIGEPPNAFHPVAWMGSVQRALRRLAPRGRAASCAWGVLMALVGPVVFGLGSYALLRALTPYPWALLPVEIYLLKGAFAVRALGAAALAVERALRREDLAAARFALRSLVSRDTSELGPPLLAAAAIESVAENTSDSVVAPLLGFLVAGVPGALTYRAVNTLDAMIGYHGQTEWLGKAAARLDDALNLLPARITALLVVVGAAGCHCSPVGALRIWWRDGGATESPNAGHPIAAMAGALGVRLEKVGHYRLGDGGALPVTKDIDRAVAIMAFAVGLAVLLAGAGVWVHAS